MKSRVRLVVSAVLALILTMLTMAGCERVAEETTPSPEAAAPLPSVSSGSPATGLTALLDPSSEVRGVFIATAMNIDFPSKTDLSAADLRRELDAIVAECVRAGLNTIYFQVRPVCDALYKSDLYPVSEYLSSSRTLTIDPLGYLIEQAHKRNVFVHAWINPLRVTVGSPAAPQYDAAKLPDGSPAKAHPEWTVGYADGRLYFDPGIPAVRDYVAAGVKEIVERYNVDGVLFDDYFYPYPVTGSDGKTAAFADDASFARYGEGMKRDDWRRENVNRLVQACYFAVKNVSPAVQFGVAPFGIWQNGDGSEAGSATSGLQAYSAIYCDAKAWIRGGYLDYLAPQIYWQMTSKTASFDELVRWWNRELDGTGIHLLVSHGAYNYDEWTDPAGEMKQQVRFARAELTYRGSIFYGYDEIRRNAHGLRDELNALYASEIVYSAPSPNGLGVRVSSPPSGTYVNAANTYLLGSSSPDYVLTMNGVKLGRTRGGFFSVYVPLEPGENVFTLEQNGMTYTHRVFRGTAPASGTAASAPAEMKAFEILSVTPSKPVMKDGGATVTVTCTAPAGSTVKATVGYAVVGNTVVTLKQSGTARSQNGKWIAASYSGTITLPKAGDDEIRNLGQIVVTATQGSQSARESTAAVRVRGANAYLPVRVLADDTELKLGYDTSYYEDFSVQSAGMTDYAVAQENGMYKLRVGGYVYETAVEELASDVKLPIASISALTVSADADATTIRIGLNGNVPHNGTVFSGAFQLTLYNVDVKSVPDAFDLSKNPLIDKITVAYPNKANCVRFAFRLYSTDNFYGFETSYADGCMLVKLRNPRWIDLSSRQPLAGLRIVVDAGHGGIDSGALGPLHTPAASFSEKDLNLSVALVAAERLEKLGAAVTLTRKDDSTYDLMKRVDFLIGEKPDLFVSVHQNSLGYASDIRRVRGTVGLWWADAGVLAADTVARTVADALGFPQRETAQQMLAVCRNPKFPSALIEVSFMTDVEEYDFMITDGCDVAGAAIAQGILNYYELQQQWVMN